MQENNSYLNEPIGLLKALLKHIDDGEDIQEWQFGNASEVLLGFPSQAFSCDELLRLKYEDKCSYFCNIDGHGLQGNYFVFHLLSDSLRVSVSIPYGNVYDAEKQNERFRCVVALLFLLLQNEQRILTKFGGLDSGCCCLSCQPDYYMHLRITDGDDVICEEKDGHKILALIENAMEENKQDSQWVIRA